MEWVGNEREISVGKTEKWVCAGVCVCICVYGGSVCGGGVACMNGVWVRARVSWARRRHKRRRPEANG